MKKLALIVLAGLLNQSLSAKEYHVSVNGIDNNDGSTSKPFRTISAAAQITQPGDVITVHEGNYRERVTPPRGGVSDSKRITYQAAKGEKVVIKGSEHPELQSYSFQNGEECGVLPAINIDTCYPCFGIEFPERPSCRGRFTNAGLAMQPAVHGLSAFGERPEANGRFFQLRFPIANLGG